MPNDPETTDLPLDFDAVREQSAAAVPSLKQVQQMPAQPMSPMSSQDMIAYALQKNMVDALDRLVAMKNAEEDRANAKEFSRHFSEMQRDFPPVFRDGTAKDGAKFLYSYITLDAILKVYAPIIAKHGFAFRWSEEEIKEGKEKRVWCLVSGYGHEEKTYVDLPVLAATSFSNPVQQRGSTTSYGKRYSFMNLFGVIVADEDDDAGSFEDGVKLSQAIQLIREATTQAQRKQAYMAGIQAPGTTDKEKVLLANESKAKAKALHDAGVTE